MGKTFERREEHRKARKSPCRTCMSMVDSRELHDNRGVCNRCDNDRHVFVHQSNNR